jgi:hypothetical protein
MATANTSAANIGLISTDNGTSVLGRSNAPVNFTVAFGGQRGGSDVEGMTFNVTDAELPFGFEYAFVQVVHSAEVALVNTRTERGAPLYMPPQEGLDNNFPYPLSNVEWATDSPFYPYEGRPALRDTQTLWGRYNMSMYYMCRPDGPDAIWIPLGVFNWRWSWDVTIQGGKPSVKSPEHSSAPQPFQDTTKFPEWKTIVGSQFSK